MASGQVVLYALLAGLGLWMLHKIGHAVTQAPRGRGRDSGRVPRAWLAAQGGVEARPVAGPALAHHHAPRPPSWRGCTGGAGLPRDHRGAVTAGVAAVALAAPVVVRALRRAGGCGAGGSAGSSTRRGCPAWLRACGLTVVDPGQPVTVQVTPFRRSAVQPKTRPRRDQIPRVVGVRSGPSWDEVRVRLVPGQTPEDFDQAARALAVARGVARCQVRELGPDLVSIDYQRRDRLADVVACRGPRRPGRRRRGGHRPAQGLVRSHRVRH